MKSHRTPKRIKNAAKGKDIIRAQRQIKRNQRGGF